jgi:GT2 family glycosyltransferase
MVDSEYAGVRLIRNSDNRGFASANNQAIRSSNGRHVLLLNSDAIILPDTAPTMVRYLDDNERVGIVGARLLNLDGTFQASYNDFPSLYKELLVLTGLGRWLLPQSYPSYPDEQSRERREVDWVGGACLMVRRSAIDAAGLLDEEYFMYSEELDWCHRIKKEGWSIVYLPDARAIHGSGASSQRVPERRRAQVYRGKWLYLRKHRGPWVAVLFGVLVRLFTTAKLVGWLLITPIASRERRENGQRQIASYRYLLANF